MRKPQVGASRPHTTSNERAALLREIDPDAGAGDSSDAGPSRARVSVLTSYDEDRRRISTGDLHEEYRDDRPEESTLIARRASILRSRARQVAYMLPARIVGISKCPAGGVYDRRLHQERMTSQIAQTIEGSHRRVAWCRRRAPASHAG